MRRLTTIISAIFVVTLTACDAAHEVGEYLPHPDDFEVFSEAEEGSLLARFQEDEDEFDFEEEDFEDEDFLEDEEFDDYRPADYNNPPMSPHMAAMSLVAMEDATHMAVASGNWSDAGTWRDGALPTEGARVIIPQGVSVTVAGIVPESIKTIGLMGALTFDPTTDTELRVDTIISMEGSRLEIGTANAPIQQGVTARVIFADDGPVNRGWDPQQLSRGAVLMGQTEMFGAEKTAWAVLAEHPRAGDTSIEVEGATNGWAVGDELVIAATDPYNPEHDDLVRISAIDGSTITLDRALQYDHVPPVADLDVHVANLTRNIVFTSENTDIAHRGHIMFMHTLDVSISYARFTELGRTDKSVKLDDFSFPDLDDGPTLVGPGNNVRGRYSLHFHRGGTAPGSIPALVQGSVVTDDPGWAYVNHSANVDFISNVSYHILGGAYQTEAGDEVGSFVGNIALHTINPEYPLLSDTDELLIDIREDAQDFAFQGDAFWLHGGGVRVDDNVVAGASGHAYVYWPEGLIEARPDGPQEMTDFDVANVPGADRYFDRDWMEVWHVPVVSFNGNTAYAATKGLEFYYLHTSFLDNESNYASDAYRSQLESVFENLTIWNMAVHGIGFNYTENLTFRNVRLVGNGDPNIVGVDADHFHLLGTHRFDNLTVEGFGVGMQVPTQGQVLVEGGTYANLVDFEVRNPHLEPRDLTFRDINFGDSPYVNDAERIRFEMTPDFTLTGVVQTGLESDGVDKFLLYFLLPDRITLDFGPYDGVALYYAEQAADFVPVTEENKKTEVDEEQVPQEYVGLSNEQLMSRYGLSFGGELLPTGSEPSTDVVGGLIGPQVPAPTVEVFDLLESDHEEDFEDFDDFEDEEFFEEDDEFFHEDEEFFDEDE